MNLDSLGELACLHALQVALLSGIVWVLVNLFAKDRPHLAHALWALVLLKCLTPPVIASPLSPFSWLDTERSVASSVESPAQAPHIRTDLAPSPRVRISYHPPSEAATPVLPLAELPATSITPVFSVWLFVGAAWLASTTLIGLMLCWRVAAYARLIRRKTIATPANLQELTNKLGQKLGVHRAVRVRVVDGPIGPAVVGLLRPTLLLPDCIVRSQSRLNLQPLIAHELVHVRRGDLWWSAVQTIASLLWWFHPCVWLASRLLTRETERSCDEETISSLGCRPAEYARSLLDVLERKSEIVAAPLVPGVRPVDITWKRMERIMRIGHGSHHRTPRWVMALLLIGAALALPGARWLGAQEGDTNLKEKPAEVYSSPGKRLPRAPGLQNQPASPAQPSPKLDIASPAYKGKDVVILDIQILNVPSELVKELLAESQRKDDSLGVSTAQLHLAAEELTYDAQLKGAVFSDLGVVGNLVTHENQASGNPGAVITASGSSAETHIASQSTKLPTVLHSEQLATVDGWMASKSETKVEQINAPRITTYSGVRATCTIGQQRPFVRAMEGPQDKQPSIQVVQTGLTCEFTPTVDGPDGHTIEVLCNLSRTEITGVQEIEKTADDGSTLTLQHPTVRKQEVTFGINVPNSGTFAATLGTKQTDAGETTTLYVVRVDKLTQTKANREETSSNAAAPNTKAGIEEVNAPQPELDDGSVKAAPTDQRNVIGNGLVVDMPVLGPASLGFDFAFPTPNANTDESQVFSFFMGMNRN